MDIELEENVDQVVLFSGDDVHYISWISGIILTCLYVSIVTIIPMHNPIIEPQYFWEFMLFAAFGWASVFTGQSKMMMISNQCYSLQKSKTLIKRFFAR